MNTQSPTAVVVGLGKQGAGIAKLIVEHGYTLLGAVDIGDKVGQPVSSFLDGIGPADPVVGSVDEVLSNNNSIDIAILTAAIDADKIVEQASAFLSRGIDVITLHQDLLAPHESWTPALEKVALEGGASFLSTGAQDTWWVQLPAIIAASSSKITKIRLVSNLSLDALSVGLAQIIGVGQDEEAFKGTAAMMLHAPATLGAALAESARLMGAGRPGEMPKTWSAITSDEPFEWVAGGITIPAGNAVGTREVASFTSESGIVFEGEFSVNPFPLEDAYDELYIEGEPNLGLRYQPFPGEGVTNVSLMARIPDVLEAEPGILFAADLPPARHHFPLTTLG